jgi:hypothetical protein
MSHLFPLGLESPGPRLRSLESDRSPVRLMAIIAEHHHRGSARYAPRDVTGDGKADTWCNLFAQDVAEAMGVPLPRNTRANDLAAWLGTLGTQSGWVQVSESVAQIHADAGGLSLASTVNPKGPGHLAVLVPSLGEAGTWIAQAGAINFTRKPLRAGFGNLEPRLFAHR